MDIKQKRKIIIIGLVAVLACAVVSVGIISYFNNKKNATPVTIAFNTTGGFPVAESVTVSIGTNINAPVEPKRNGYTFDGWYNQPNGGNRIEFPFKAEKSLTIYAQWILIQYVVSFDSNGGNFTPMPVVGFYDSVVEDPEATPTRANYLFVGWFTEASGGYYMSFPFSIRQDMTLYAHWMPILYTVAFNPTGGAPTPSAKTQNYGTTVSAPNAPARLHYEFAGWFTEAVEGTRIIFPYTVTKNVTLYAHWVALNYVISFNADGGTPEPEPQTIEYGGYVEKPADPYKEGEIFVGWFIESVAYGFSSTPVSASFVLKAKYEEPMQNVYSVYYESNGGTIYNVIEFVSEGERAPEKLTARQGYSFGGWFHESNFVTLWNFQDDLVYSNVTIYAKWTILQFTATFNGNGGSPSLTSDTQNYGTQINAPSQPTRSQFKFDGWTTAQNGGTKVTFPYTITQNVTLYASWIDTITRIPWNNSVSGNITLSTVNSNYAFNHALAYPTGYINGQSKFSSWLFDGDTLNNNGCGIIATYNAFYALGYQLDLAELIRYYEATGGTARYWAEQNGFGFATSALPSLGSTPHHILTLVDVLNAAYNLGIQKQTMSSETNFKNYANSMGSNMVMTLTFWNGTLFGLVPNPNDGAHTIAFTKTNNAEYPFAVYNRTNSSSAATNYKTPQSIYSSGMYWELTGSGAFLLWN